MRVYRHTVSWALLAASLAARGAAQSSLSWAEDISERECSPQNQIYQLVLGANEGEYVVDGKPKVTVTDQDMGKYEHLPRGCSKWAGKETCCKPLFYELLDFEWKDEAEHFEAIRDVYTHFVPDVIQPAIDDLTSHSQGDLSQKLTEVAALLGKEKVGQAMAEYIDSCEDPIRLHFAATTCELCNPEVGKKLLEGKYLEVNSNACANLWTPCSKATCVFESLAHKLSEASLKLKAVVDAGVKSDKVIFAYNWISGAERQLATGVKRIEFYRDQEEFCSRLQQKGYIYNPQDWGNIDLLHPGLAQESSIEGQATEVVTLVSTQVVTAKDAQCVHGWKRGNTCFCQPCWEGVLCEKPSLPGPMRGQPFSPLVAEDVVGSQQSMGVIGCQLPTDLNALLSRVKFLEVKPASGAAAKHTLAGASMDEEDPCPLRAADAGSFRELPLQTPVSTTETRLEYLVQAPQGSEGLYAVCYCYGPECLLSETNWYRVGHVKVVRTDQQVAEEEIVELKIAEKDPASMEAKTGPPTCDAQWKNFPMDSVTFNEEGKDAVTFECKLGYSDLAGPFGLKCDKGIWYAIVDSQQAATLNLTKVWDRQLPRCRWSRRNCPSPVADSRLAGGGSVHVEDGIAKYTCPFDMEMLVDGDRSGLRAGQKVVMKTGLETFKIVSALGKSADPEQQEYAAVATVETWDSDAMTKKIMLREVWRVIEESHFNVHCQPDGTWAPAVTVRCLREGGSGTSGKAGQGEGGSRAVAVTSRATAVSQSVGVAVQATDASSAEDATHGHGPCGGTFGVPEVHRGEALALVENLLPVGKGARRQTTASMLELGLEAPQTVRDLPPLQLGELGASARPQAAGTASFMELGDGGSQEQGAASSQATVGGQTSPAAALMDLAGSEAGASGSRSQARASHQASSMGSTRIANRHVSHTNALDEGGQQLRIRKWPVRFTKDAARSFTVDKCWTTRSCSRNGETPKDTAAALEPAQPKEENITGRPSYLSRGLVAAGCLVALSVSVLLRSLYLSVCAVGAAKRRPYVDREAASGSLSN